MKNKKLRYSILIILVLIIPFLFYLFNFRMLVFNEGYYQSEFRKHGVYSEIEDADEINSGVLSDFKGGKLLPDFFTNEEKSHLEDVKNLIQKSLLFFYSLIIIFLILIFSLFCYLKNKKNFKKIFKKDLGLVLIIGGLLAFLDAFIFYLMVKLNFDFVFEWFHRIFFTGNWMFSTGIVVLYPGDFFYDFFARVIVNTLLMGLGVVVVGFWLRGFVEKFHDVYALIYEVLGLPKIMRKT